MLYYKRLDVAIVYIKGDKDDGETEYFLFFESGQYGFVYTLFSLLVALLDLVEYL